MEQGFSYDRMNGWELTFQHEGVWYLVPFHVLEELNDEKIDYCIEKLSKFRDRPEVVVALVIPRMEHLNSFKLYNV